MSSERDAPTFDPLATGAVTTAIAPLAPTSVNAIAPTSEAAIAPTSEASVTPTSEASVTRTSASAIARTSERSIAPSRRFAPGAIIAGRYRLIAMLGRGGMGEVYRADDLTLDLPVALKFLPAAIGADERSLARFHNELRVARQVSHKNVCRLYDVGEADGHRFLTMEYIDGEDLSSLLRRIGRLPQDKAVQIARQLCAGVAAAHDRRVLHRDLKPANVMIDGQGDARVTDFGIATAAADADHEFVGTPQYMAPELFAGQPASVQSDVYALGLTLYELFTGRRAYESKTLEGLKQAHLTGTLPTPTTIVRDLDPAIDRAIMRCLEKDPGRRPASALAVAAMLPGADALADALAAGETPSPELLAAAGESEALTVWTGVAAIVLTLVGLLAFAGISGRVSIFGRTPHALPPAVLADRAKAVISAAGYMDIPADEAYELTTAGGYVNWVRNNSSASNRLAVLSNATPSALQFWYRSSLRELAALSGGVPTLSDPPQEISGMQSVVLDGAGRLQQFRAVPPQRETIEGDAPAADWMPLFRAAGLDAAAYTPVTPEWTPRDYADARFAWEGPVPGLAGQTLRIEVGSYRGRPVAFALVMPWTAPTLMVPRATDPIDRIFLVAAVTLFVAVVAAAIVLARRNLQQNRADRRGATRVAAAIALAILFAWIASALYAGVTVLDSHLRAAANAAFFGMLVWTLYVALEPYARRFWPYALLGWARLLAGHVRDARVGRDVLIGVLVGTLLAYGDVLRSVVMPWLGYREPQPVVGTSLRILLGPGPLMSEWLTWAFLAMLGALLIVMGLVLARLLLRRMWLVIAVASVLLAFTAANFMGTSSQWMWLFALSAGIVVSTATVRFGLLALIVSRFVWYVLSRVPMTGDVSHWSAAPSNWSLALIVALACFGFYASRAGRPLFGSVLAD